MCVGLGIGKMRQDDTQENEIQVESFESDTTLSSSERKGYKVTPNEDA